jgi:hypothetical protein
MIADLITELNNPEAQLRGFSSPATWGGVRYAEPNVKENFDPAKWGYSIIQTGLEMREGERPRTADSPGSAPFRSALLICMRYAYA